MRTNLTAASLLLTVSALAVDVPSPLSPQQELASFQFADPSLTIELVAAEPEVVSPVAIAWDEDGRMFVAEMSDYPTGPSPGRVRMLEDRDADGRYETATIFADQLPFPNGVLPWNGGVLVTAAPNLWFFKDTNGDGAADERRVIFTGFGEGNQQLRANGLTFGLDNWIYGANGRSEGDIRRPHDTNTTSIRGRDFRFRPDSGLFEAVAGRSQFGLARDDWGNRFLSWNTIPIRHEVLPERYLARNAHLAATESLQDILAPGDTGRVFPLTPAPLTFNDESTSHFNALAGLTLYRGDALGAVYRGNAFVGESLRNLVHRRVLETSGVTFIARRGEEGREFLAATDPWFHPVNFATGPDGALYIVDFYRRFVEHPAFVHNEGVVSKIPWRTGAEHGRIWRVRAKEAKLEFQGLKLGLSRASPQELVRHLEDANGWWRDTAQRLLVEKPNPRAIPSLERMAERATSPVAKVCALHALDGLNALDSSLLLGALRDDHPRVRERAVLLSEPRFRSAPALIKSVAALAGDSDSRVRLQVALSLGAVEGDQKWKPLARMSGDFVTNRWLALAVLSSVGPRAWLFLDELVNSDPGWIATPSGGQTRFLEQVAALIGAGSEEPDTARFLNLLTNPRAVAPTTAALSLLAGYADGLARTKKSLRELVSHPPAGMEKQVRDLRPLFESAALLAQSDSAALPQRVTAVRVLQHGEPVLAGKSLLVLMQSAQPDELQRAASRALAEMGDVQLCRALFTNWGRSSPALRRKVLTASLRSSIAAAVLTEALEEKQVSAMELDAASREALRKVLTADWKLRLEKILQQNAAEDRQQVVRSFSSVLKLAGDRQRGAAVFAKNCMICHAIQGRGQRVGPDLSGVTGRAREALLVDILDPSRQVSPDFISYDLVKVGGDTVSGLIAGETATSVTVRRSSQPDETVLRGQIREMRASGKSLMPDGLEQGLDEQALADVLDFLRQPDIGMLPKEN